jgi:hypothetical protein
MAQFDPLIILPLILSLFITLVLYYSISIGAIIPDFFEVKKFREKKIQSQFFYAVFNKNKSTNSMNSYKSIFF